MMKNLIDENSIRDIEREIIEDLAMWSFYPDLEAKDYFKESYIKHLSSLLPEDLKQKYIRKKIRDITKIAKIADEIGDEEVIAFFDLPLQDSNLPLEAKSIFLLSKGCHLLRKKDWTNARKSFEDSKGINPKNIFAMHALSLLLYKMHLPSEALQLLDDVISINAKDLLAYKTKLEVLIDMDEIEEAEKVHKKIEELLENNSSSSPPEIVLSVELTCIRYLSKVGEIFEEKREEEKADKQFNDVSQGYENLIKKVPELIKENSERGKIEAVIRNAYACFLIDTFKKRDEGLTQLEKALEAYPDHIHSLHKKVSVYLNEEINLEEKEKEIREDFKKIQKIDRTHHPAKRSLLILDRKLGRWGNTDSEKEFWEGIYKIYGKYQEILEPEGNYLNLDNAITYFDLGCFLSSAEAKAYNKGFLNSKPPELPPADEPLRKSIDIVEKHIDNTRKIKRDVKYHLALAYHFLGSYLVITAKGDKNKFDEGHFFLKKGVGISEEVKFEFHSLNSYVEASIGKFLWEIGEKEKGKKYLKKAVDLYKKNWRVRWWLGRAYEEVGEFNQAYKYFKECANGQRSPKLFGELRNGIVKNWIEEGKCNIVIGLLRRLECSKRAHRLDANNLRNISDYAHDLYELGRKAEEKDILKKAKELFNIVCKRYKEEENKKEEGYNFWFVAECEERIKGEIDRQVAEHYLESVTLNPEWGYEKLQQKLSQSDLKTKFERERKINPAYTYISFTYRCGCFPPEDLLMGFKNIDFPSKNSEVLFKETAEVLNVMDPEHVKFITSLTSAILRRGLLTPKKIKESITKSGKICSIPYHHTTSISELNVWKNIFEELGLQKEAESCAKEILKRKPQDTKDVHVLVGELIESDLTDKALSVMEELLDGKLR